MQIYISYAKPDEAFARNLSSQLAKRGLSVWSAYEKVLPGDNIWLRTGEALKRSKAMIVLVSPDSMQSEHVRREIEYALGDPNYQGRVFPVQVRPTKNVPWIFERFRTFDAKQGAARISGSIAETLKQVTCPTEGVRSLLRGRRTLLRLRVPNDRSELVSEQRAHELFHRGHVDVLFILVGGIGQFQRLIIRILIA